MEAYSVVLYKYKNGEYHETENLGKIRKHNRLGN